MVKRGSIVSVTLKEDEGHKADIDRYVTRIVKDAGKSGIELSTLGTGFMRNIRFPDQRLRLLPV